MEGVNHQIVLARRPQGMVDESCFAAAEAPVPEPGDGEVLVRVEYVSIDPAIRGWLNERGSGYLPGVGIGEPVRSNGVGVIVESRADTLPVGTYVTILSGWQEYAVGGTDLARPFQMVTPIPEGATPLEAVSLLGQAGMTAWAAVTQVLRPTEGQTFVVSAAASTVGSLAGQLAQRAGARVVGIAGGPRKCRWCVEELGFDACIDYKSQDVYAALKEHCPGGVDVFFDNVGGELLDTVLRRLAVGGRVLLCGTLAADNASEPYALRNYDRLMSRRARMEGFNTMDWWGQFGEATKELLAAVRDGTIKYAVEVLHGLEQAPAALVRLYRGDHLGKLVIEVPEPAAPPR